MKRSLFSARNNFVGRLCQTPAFHRNALQSAAILFFIFAILGCVSPQTKEQLNALRTLKPIHSDGHRPPLQKKDPKDSDLLRALENMQPLSGVIWSWPKPSLELVKAPPGTNWHDRELIFWIKETLIF